MGRVDMGSLVFSPHFVYYYATLYAGLFHRLPSLSIMFHWLLSIKLQAGWAFQALVFSQSSEQQGLGLLFI